MMQTESSILVSQDETAKPDALKIRGFLIFVAIMLILGVLQNVTSLGWALLPVREPVWQRLTSPESSFYDPHWKPALVFSVVSASTTLSLTIIALVLFFRRHRFFPTFIVVAIPLGFVLTFVNYFLDSLVPANVASSEYARQTEHLIVRFISLHVWIPYFLVSNRVKRTFVR